MKRAIIVRFVAVLLLALAMSSVVSYYFIGKTMLNQNMSSMRNTIHVVDYALNYKEDMQEQIARLNDTVLDPDSRITIIGADGTVYADNGVQEVTGLENHMEREEVREALNSGEGYATRYSDSLEQNMLYVAVRSRTPEYVVRMAVPYTNILDYYVIIFPVLLVGIGLALAISVVIAVRFADTITTPLQEISEEMEKVRLEKPDFSFREYKYKELNVISETTLKMGEEIHTHMSRLEKEKKIRQEFFSNASHELKTPITSIRGYVELLDQGLVRDETVRKDFYSRILKETANMTNLINDILMISRLEAKEAEVHISAVKMEPLLNEILESLEPIASEYQVSVHCELEPVEIEASAKQLRELIVNLVSNGIKYNHPGGNVWIHAKKIEQNLVISVSDDGYGIDTEHQDRIFERFYRIDKGRSKKMGGTGLGLSIVKHIVEYYGGTIRLESQLGKGSCFTVMIPVN